MILSLITVLAVTQSVPTCDSSCVDILATAAEWALQDTPGADGDRAYLDLGGSEDTPTGQEDTGEGMGIPSVDVLADVARVTRLPTVTKTRHAAWQVCAEAPTSEVCRASAGTTYVTLRGPELLPDGQARVHTSVWVLGGVEGELQRSHVSGAELLITRTPTGSWTVTEVLLRIVS